LNPVERGGLSAEALENLLRLSSSHPREIDALRALLEENGMATEPPADWQPPE
jgi:hypothetical protein